jgi:predicted nucleic acid-binding Zn ribbon protein
MRRRPPKFEPPLSWRSKRTPHQSILAQWRGIDLAEQEKASARNSKSAADLMPAVLKKIGLEEKQANLEILRVWNNLIDPLIVQHARPVGLCKGTLFVNVDSSVWMDEIIRYRRREILHRLQTSFGPDLIKRISFRPG